MSDITNPVPDWYADPTGRFEQRYWDGTQWTEHVSSAGQQRTDPLPGSAPPDAATSDLPALGDIAGSEATGTAAAPIEPAPGWPGTAAAAVEPEPEPEPVAGVVVPAASAVSADPGGPAADWYADPTGRFEQRYWDGGQWTEHVTSAGVPATDPLPDEPETADDEDGGDVVPDTEAEAGSAVEANPFAAASPAEPSEAADVTDVFGSTAPAEESAGDDRDAPATDPLAGGGPLPGGDPVLGAVSTPASAAVAPAADWYPDPSGRQELRYWDGAQWTEHASSGGRQVVDPLG